MISSMDYSDLNSSGSSDDESINWECGPSGDLNFFSNRRNVNRKRNQRNVQGKKETFSRRPGKSSRRGLTSLPNCIYEIQNPSINSVFGESESIAIDIQSDAESAFEIDQEETYEFVLIEEAKNNVPSEPLVNPVNNSCKVDNTYKENTKNKPRPTVKTPKDVIVKQIIFLCDNCDISFTSNEDLKEHYATSETCSKKYKCFLCPFSADRNPTIKLHLAFEHNRTEVYSCYHCSNKAGSKKELKLHIKNKHFKEFSVDELSQHKQSQDSISNGLKMNKKKDDKPSVSNQDCKNYETTIQSKKLKLNKSNKTSAMTRSQISYSAKNNNFCFKSNKSYTTKLKKGTHKSNISIT